MKVMSILSVLFVITVIFVPANGGINLGSTLLAAPQQGNPDISEEMTGEEDSNSYFMSSAWLYYGSCFTRWCTLFF